MMSGHFPIPLLLAALAVASPGWTDEAATGAPFLNLPVSVRQAGMGNLAVGGNDIMRSWSNPSLLAGQYMELEAALNGSAMYGAGSLTMGGGFGWRFMPECAVGLITTMVSTGFDEIDVNGNKTGEDAGQSSVATGAVLAGGFELAKAGLLVKFISESDPQGQTESFSGMGVDLGVSVRFRSLSAGASVRNAAGGISQAGGNEDGELQLPVERRVGVAAILEPWPVKAGVELVSRDDYYGEDWGGGVEWRITDSFGLRTGGTGLGYGYPVRMTFGLSAIFRKIGIDIASTTHPLGLTHMLSLTCSFGRVATERAGAEPPPAESVSPSTDE